MDPNTAVVVVAIVGVLVPLSTLVVSFIKDRAAAILVAAQVEKVRVDLVRQNAETTGKMDEIARVGVDTHTLVNSNMGVQLKLNAALSRRMANITKSNEDIQAAELAEIALAEHIKKQAIVDSGEKKPQV